MSDQEIDQIIVNLKVLASLEENKKLLTKQRLLNVETPNYIPEFIRRTLRGDNRDSAVKKIDEIISRTINLLNDHLELNEYLLNARNGLIKLKITYDDCTQTKARIDTLIDKIDRATKPKEIDPDDF